MEVIPALMNLSRVNTHFRSNLKFYFLSSIYVFNRHHCHILRENSLDFLKTEGANHPRIQCDRPLVDIYVIIDEMQALMLWWNGFDYRQEKILSKRSEC